MLCNDHIYLSQYAHDHDLLDNPVWKQLRRYVNNTKKINRLLKSDKAKQHRDAVKIKFGIKIPRDHKEVVLFDTKNGDNDSKDFELL